MSDEYSSDESSWRRLSEHLRQQWREITARGSFDLSKVFPSETAAHALKVHLFFVKLLGEKLRADEITVDQTSFAGAVRNHTPHPDVTLLIADMTVANGQLLSHDSDVSVLRQGEVVLSALWTHRNPPVAVKICYLRPGAPVRAPDGFPWHPLRQRKIVKLSPYKGDTQPVVARRDLRIIARGEHE
jgi:hypothetical protein